MSSSAVALVLNHSGRSGTEQLVLVGIAEHSGDGGSWPSVATLARYAGVQPRNVMKAVRKLEVAGVIRVLRNSGGSPALADYRRPNRYEILIRCPVDCDGSMWHRTKRWTQGPLPPVDNVPVMPATPPDASDTPPPDASDTPPPDASDTRTTPVKAPTEPTTSVALRDQPPVGAVETVDNRRDAGCPIHVGAKRRPDGECSGHWADRIAADAEPVSAST